MLLPKHSYLSALITRLLISLVKSRFKIIGVCRLVYEAIKSCITCVKLGGMNIQPKMADVPVSRVQACCALTTVGIDYPGLLMMK